MNRAERRRQEKATEKKTNTYTLTQAEIDKIKQDAVVEAANIAFVLCLGIPLMVLRDGKGWGKKRLEWLMEKCLEQYDCFQKGYITLDEIKKIIKEETGAEFVEEA